MAIERSSARGSRPRPTAIKRWAEPSRRPARQQENLCEAVRSDLTIVVAAWRLDDEDALHREGPLADLARLVVERAWDAVHGKGTTDGTDCLVCGKTWARDRAPVALVTAEPFANPERGIFGATCGACTDHPSFRAQLIAVLEQYFQFTATTVRDMQLAGCA